MKKFAALASLFVSAWLMGQTGPAGVGNASSNIVWLKADAGSSTTVSGNAVSQWNDQSGNSNNVAQATGTRQPLYRSTVASAFNGMPAMEFDNDATNYDYLTCPDNATLDGFNAMSAFSVYRLNSGTPAGTPRAIFSKRVDPSTNNDYGWFQYTNNFMYLDVNGTTYRMNTATAYATGTDYLVGFAFDASLASNDQKMYNGNSLDAQGNNPANTVPNYASDFHVGVLYGHTGSNKQFNGYIPEVIVYNTAVNPAQRYIVNNYLSAKYNIALSSNDYYAGDTPANGDFDREVAGIGQSSAGNTNNAFSSSVCAGMGIAYVSGFDDGDYVLAGHNLPANANINSDIAVVSGGPLAARWQRTWYIDVTNTGSAMTTDVTFDLSDGGFTGNAGLASDYKLLYRSTNSGSWTIVATASSTNGDQVTFSNFSFNTNDGYYTIGTLNATYGTLPVEWLFFDATPENGNDVRLEWATASEVNADYFVVERADAMSAFTAVAQTDASGNSSFTHYYYANDYDLASGIYYYRLREVDFNGQYHYSAIRTVEISGNDFSVTTLPNPSGETFAIMIGQAWLEDRVTLTIVDAQGRLVEFLEPENTLLSLRLSPGLYFIRLSSASGKTQTLRQVVTE